MKKKDMMSNRGRKFKTTKQRHRIQTLYVRRPAVWEEARRKALTFDDSLSNYVELALVFFNKGGW